MALGNHPCANKRSHLSEDATVYWLPRMHNVKYSPLPPSLPPIASPSPGWLAHLLRVCQRSPVRERCPTSSSATSVRSSGTAGVGRRTAELAIAGVPGWLMVVSEPGSLNKLLRSKFCFPSLLLASNGTHILEKLDFSVADEVPGITDIMRSLSVSRCEFNSVENAICRRG